MSMTMNTIINRVDMHCAMKDYNREEDMQQAYLRKLQAIRHRDNRMSVRAVKEALIRKSTGLTVSA